MTVGTFGDRPPFKIRRVEVVIRDDGGRHRLFHCQSGFWNGPDWGGIDKGFYSIEKFIVDDRFPLFTLSKNVSFWPQLAKALGCSL